MLDEISLIIFLSSIAIYAIFLTIRFKSNKPFKLTLFNLIYENWAENRLNKRSEISTVQILRNIQVANSTLISALFVLLGILLGFYNSSFLDDTPFFGITELGVGLVKTTLNVIVIIFCVMNFILSIRAATRCSIFISGDPQKYEVQGHNGLEAVKDAFLSSKNHWMYGIRGLFYLTATLLWFINFILFIGSTILITAYLLFFRDTKKIKK